MKYKQMIIEMNEMLRESPIYSCSGSYWKGCVFKTLDTFVLKVMF